MIVPFLKFISSISFFTTIILFLMIVIFNDIKSN